MSLEDYMWKYSAPYLRIMAHDATKTLYLSEKQSKAYYAKLHEKQYTDPDKLMNDLGLPIF